MKSSWKDSIYLQREELARTLRDPLGQLAERCAPAWGDCEQLDAMLALHFSSIPHCSYLYCVGTDGIQICNNVSEAGVEPGHRGRDRSHHGLNLGHLTECSAELAAQIAAAKPGEG
jgi:hypothetical protein